MYAIISTAEDGSIDVLRTCHTKEAAIIAAQLEKDKVSPMKRRTITAVVMDDGGYQEIIL